MKHRIALVIAILFLAASAPAQAGAFDLVPPGHWAYDALGRLAAAGLVPGYPSGSAAARPSQGMTRYELALAVSRAQDALGDHEGLRAGDARQAVLEKLRAEFRVELERLALPSGAPGAAAGGGQGDRTLAGGTGLGRGTLQPAHEQGFPVRRASVRPTGGVRPGAAAGAARLGTLAWAGAGTEGLEDGGPLAGAATTAHLQLMRGRLIRVPLGWSQAWMQAPSASSSPVGLRLPDDGGERLVGRLGDPLTAPSLRGAPSNGDTSAIDSEMDAGVAVASGAWARTSPRGGTGLRMAPESPPLPSLGVDLEALRHVDAPKSAPSVPELRYDGRYVLGASAVVSGGVRLTLPPDGASWHDAEARANAGVDYRIAGATVSAAYEIGRSREGTETTARLGVGYQLGDRAQVRAAYQLIDFSSAKRGQVRADVNAAFILEF